MWVIVKKFLFFCASWVVGAAVHEWMKVTSSHFNYRKEKPQKAAVSKWCKALCHSESYLWGYMILHVRMYTSEITFYLCACILGLIQRIWPQFVVFPLKYLWNDWPKTAEVPEKTYLKLCSSEPGLVKSWVEADVMELRDIKWFTENFSNFLLFRTVI